MRIRLLVVASLCTILFTGCATQTTNQLEMVSDGPGIAIKNMSKPDNNQKISLSASEWKVVDANWTETSHAVANESKVADRYKVTLLRVLFVMSIGTNVDSDCSKFDLSGIQSIDLADVSTTIIEKARPRVPNPTYAELWSVKACEVEDIWLVIGADKFPYVSSTPGEH